MKISFITTVLNEEGNIGSFISSLFSQRRMPDEIIIVDGGSNDKTIENIKNYISSIKEEKFKKIKFKLLSIKGNRSVGRNEAIGRANGDIILCSDAGNLLDKNWIKNITKPFRDSTVEVVAGYYKEKAQTIFQKCLATYALVSGDKIDPKNFLPSTRSIAFKKSIWKIAGGFPEEYSHNEDYVFAKTLQKIGAKIVFAKKAIVYWIPRKTIKEAFIMFFRFALGDGESGILRSKVMLIFTRYILGFYLLLLSFIEKSLTPSYGLFIGLFLYILWSIKKNYRYTQKPIAIFFLPLLQFTSDLAILLGTFLGVIKRVKFAFILQAIKANKLIVILIGVYILFILVLINKGIPNQNHPFNYFMDEWHQAQSVRSVFTQGSPNVPGAANGSMFHFLISGIWLILFTVIGFINPFIISSPVEQLEIQQRLFQVLRLNTLSFGVASIILIAHIAKKYLNINPFFSTFLFVVNPIWLSFSNYFKYDIALIFWILLSFVFIFSYMQKQNIRNFYIASFLCGVSFAVKVSAFTLVIILIVAFLIGKEKRHFNQFFVGIVLFVGTFVLLGIPDLILGRGDIREYLYDNLVITPNLVSNYILGMHYIPYLFLKSTPAAFGFVLLFVSLLGTIFLFLNLVKGRNSFTEIDKVKLIILISFLIFLVSLIPLKIEARGNRLLVLLPFLALISGLFVKQVYMFLSRSKKKSFLLILILLMVFQIIESLSWVYVKLRPDPRQLASEWIVKNIPPKSSIGVENIPIYQFLPDVILKEFYLKQHSRAITTNFKYKIIDNLSIKDLPSYIIVSNEKIYIAYFQHSPKKTLIEKLEIGKYRKIFVSIPDLSLLKFFRDERDYFMSGLVQIPVSISIYKKVSK